MLGRGLKRKLSDYEENMAGVSSAFDSSRNLPYPLKRQLVLNVCLAKLQTYRMLVEPNLHRSVLIANTVRQIQEEMRQETSQQFLNMCSGLSASSGPSGYMGLEWSGMPSHLFPGFNQQESNSYEPRPVEGPMENGLLMVSDNDMSSAISSILKDLDFMEDVSPPTHLTGSGDDQFKAPEALGLRSDDDRQDLKGVECAFGSFEISTSYLKDLAIDDIFEDIDTSMYDADFDCPSITPPRPSPVPPMEEILKTFPSCNSSSASNIPICRSDLSDLDHIMEILVGS
ncbi:SERTA domain-containing protein 2-like [Tiliqua scincoides]|uniref:SERTA domain-containing protein 2-like n=1 Tax=Tiliqua scincoides TaxID=71010 RepID=UPI003461BB04